MNSFQSRRSFGGKRPRVAIVAACIAAGAALPGLALAHAGVDSAAHHGALDALFAGLAHPLTGADHLLAMLGVGLWSANFARRAWIAPVAFVLALLIGALAAPLLAGAGVGMVGVEPIVAASVLAIGLVGAMALRLPVAVGVALLSVFALMHGAAHGNELGGSAGSAALVGMLAASALLHAGGWMLGRSLDARSAMLARLVGGAMASAGAVMLGGLALAA